MNYNMMRSTVKGIEMNRSKKKRLGGCNMKKIDLKKINNKNKLK